MSDNYWEQPHYLEKQEKRKRDIASASELLKRVADAIRNNHDKIAGHKDGPDGWVYYIDDARAAIAAVVRALRDETEMRSCACRFWLDEILGDAGEKVGTHGSPELDEDARKLAALGQDPGATFAIDPAPVCKWTLNTLPEPDGGSHYETSCGDAWCRWYNTPKEDNYSYCPSCGKPIKFTEAKE